MPDAWNTEDYFKSLGTPKAWLAPEVISSGNPTENYLKSISNLQGVQGRETMTAGLEQKKTGMEEMQPVAEFFRRLLGGERSEVMGAVGTQADAISQQFGQVRRMFSETAPRGGGRTSTLAQAPYEETKQISQLISGARMGAAGEQAKLATSMAQLGLSEAALGGEWLKSAEQSAQERSRLAQELAQREKERKGAFWSNLGLGIGSIFANILTGGSGGTGLLGKKSPTTGGGALPGVSYGG